MRCCAYSDTGFACVVARFNACVLGLNNLQKMLAFCSAFCYYVFTACAVLLSKSKMYNAQYNTQHFAAQQSISVSVVNYTNDSVCAELMRMFNACSAAENAQYNTDALLDALNETYEEDCELVLDTQDADVVLGRADAHMALAYYEQCCYSDAQHYALLALLVRNKYLQLAIG